MHHTRYGYGRLLEDSRTIQQSSTDADQPIVVFLSALLSMHTHSPAKSPLDDHHVTAQSFGDLYQHVAA